jgi:hypothetical protein
MQERAGLYNKISSGNECGTTVERQSAANTIIQGLEDLLARADKTCCIVMERTNSVTRQEPPSVQGEKNLLSASPNFPPLFERIRELTDGINRSLNGIEDVMRRLEL